MEDALAEAGRLLLPVVIEAIAIILGAVITWLAVTIQRRTGLEIEAKHRDALHSALMSGVASAAEKLGKGVSPAVIAQEAIDHAHRSVPDAIKALKPGIDVLTNIALAKLEAMLAAQSPTVGPGPIPAPKEPI